MVQTGFIILSILVFGALAYVYRRAMKLIGHDKKEFTNTWSFPLGLGIAWFIYLLVLSEKEILFSLDFPPRFPLLIILPMILIFTLFYFKHRDKAWIKNVPITWPIYFQSFRIFVELLIAATVVQQVLPASASYHGYNFDILMGLTAPLVAYFVYSKPILKKLAIIWNILGIVMILFVGFIVATSLYFPQMWGASESLVSLQFLTLPYLLLPAFLAPTGIFLHVFSLMQLRALK